MLNPRTCYIAFFLILLTAALQVHAFQNREKQGDSLTRLADRLPRDSASYRARLSYYQSAALLFKAAGNPDKMIRARLSVASVYLDQGALNLSEKELLQVLQLDIKTAAARNRQSITFLLAVVSRYKGNFNKGLQYAMESIRNMRISGDTTSADFYYGEMGLLYGGLGQTGKSIEWYEKALDAREKKHSANYIIYRTTNLLAAQLLKRNKKKALSLVFRIKKKNPPISLQDTAILAQVMGNLYNATKNYRLAEQSYLEMIRCYQKSNSADESMSIAHQDIGKFYLERQDYQKARYHLTAALNVTAGTSSLARVRDLNYLLYEVDKALGDYRQAIAHFSLHKTLNDSIFNTTKSRQIEELQIQYETENKDRDLRLQKQNILLLRQQAELQSAELKQTKAAKNITLGGVFLLSVILILLYSRYRIKQRGNNQLQLQQKVIHEKNTSLEHLLKEKEWLLKEVHHRVKNNLQMVMSLLSTQLSYLNDEAALLAIKDSQNRIQAISLIHKKLYQSNNIAVIDLPVYIQELIEYLKDSFSSQHLIFDTDIAPLKLDAAQAVSLGLILNEAITNAIKYAFPGNRPGKISIHLTQLKKENYVLKIADNGTGLPPDFDSWQSGTLGMSLMQGLSEDLNGSFQISSESGTTILIAFVQEEISTYSPISYE